MDVLVLGLGVNGLAVVRSLGEKALKVNGIALDDDKELGKYSKYITDYKIFYSGDCADDLLRLCKSLSSNDTKPFLICTCDLFANLIAENQELFEKYFVLSVPNSNLYWKFLQKQPTAQICMDNHVPIPETIFVSDTGSLLNKLSDISYPVIIKPNLTYEESFPGKNVIAQNRNEVVDFLSQYPELETKVVVQEIIESGDGSIYVVSTYSDKNGKVQGVYCGRKIRQYLPDYGVTCFGVSESNQYLKELSVNFLETIGYEGFATLEFALDKKTGNYYFIELNIRTFYHNQLFKDAGVDLNWIAYQSSIENKDDFKLEQLDGVFWIDLTRDMGSFYRKYREKKIKISTWFRDIRRANSYAYLSFPDMKPFYMSILLLLKIAFRRLIS